MSELNFLDTGGNKQKISTPAVNSMAFNTANTERVRIDSNGDITVGAGGDLKMSSTGRIFLGDGGNATDPMFANISDTNTGLFYPSADQLAFTTGGSERLRINNYGLVTRPFQYHLHADRSGTLTGYDAGGSFGTPMVFNRIVSETKDSSLSSCFNTSNGLFTAPVTGVYLFNAAVYSGSGNIFGQSWFTLNGSRCTATDWVITKWLCFYTKFSTNKISSRKYCWFPPICKWSK
tara:strand:+ start:107 stop:808 length:702 start_codon:yes stop_codon:yes gene_type:complete